MDRARSPVLLAHGARDRTVPASQGIALEAALRRAGVQVESLLIDGVDHSFVGGSPATTHEASVRALNATLGFLDRS